jgi:hypothetical protein
VRAELVQALLHILVEACALVRMPVVIAFDNLERLLRSEDQADNGVTMTFFESLAQAVDCTHGLLILIFAESGLYQTRLYSVLQNTFISGRLNQNLPIGSEPVPWLLDLNPPRRDDVLRLIRERVGQLLVGRPEASEEPQEFPFTAPFVNDLTGEGSANLRGVLMRLRDEYQRIVFGPPVIQPTECPDWAKLLESGWTRGMSASRRLQESAGHHDYHHCLGGLLQAALPLSCDGWTLAKVQPVLAVGENPEYGVISLLHWKVEDGTAQVKGPHSLKVAVALLLASGPGMAPDLRAKFDFLHEHFKGVRLVVLWPTQWEEDLVERLPPSTRKVWDDEDVNHWRSELRRVTDLDLRRLLAFRDLVEGVAEAAEQPPSPEAVREFLHQKAGKLFTLFVPPTNTASEKGELDED